MELFYVVFLFMVGTLKRKQFFRSQAGILKVIYLVMLSLSHVIYLRALQAIYFVEIGISPIVRELHYTPKTLWVCLYCGMANQRQFSLSELQVV